MQTRKRSFHKRIREQRRPMNRNALFKHLYKLANFTKGGGNFLGDACDVSPMTLDDPVFSHINDIHDTSGVLSVNAIDELNVDVDRVVVSSEYGSSNKTYKTSCKSSRTKKRKSSSKEEKNLPLLYRESLEPFLHVPSGCKYKTGETPATVDEEIKSYADYTLKTLNNYLYETYFQVDLANKTPQLAPHVYMIGLLSIDDSELPTPITHDDPQIEQEYKDCRLFKVFSISQLMVPFEPAHIGPLLDKMFELIDAVGNYYTFVDMKPENMVHTKKDAKVYLIDTDPAFLIQDATIKVANANTGDFTLTWDDAGKTIANVRKGIMFYVFCHYIIAHMDEEEIIQKCLAKLEYWFEKSPVSKVLAKIIEKLISPPDGHCMFYKVNKQYINDNYTAIHMKEAAKYVIEEVQIPAKYEKMVIDEQCGQTDCDNDATYGRRCDDFSSWCCYHKPKFAVHSLKHRTELTPFYAKRPDKKTNTKQNKKSKK